MTQSELEYCFCTLATGPRYRPLALLLAKDIEKYAPKAFLIIYTDNPNEFDKQSNIIAFQHKPQGVKLYHDKRFAIAKALSMYNSCIFIDADMRILAPVPEEMEWLKMPGISARACDVLSKKYVGIFNGTDNSTRFIQEFKINSKAAQKLDINFLVDDDVKSIYEYLFTVTKDSGKEVDFLNYWDKIAPYFELNGMYDREGCAIGLAAAKAGLVIRWSNMPGISFFKDRTEKIRIEKGESKFEDVAVYFEQQKMFEHPKRTLVKEVIHKLKKVYEYSSRFFILRLKTLRDFNFYYR
jgi:hypothetical protein